MHFWQLKQEADEQVDDLDDVNIVDKMPQCRMVEGKMSQISSKSKIGLNRDILEIKP